MENQLSIINTEQEISLETSKEDMMSLFVKSIFGIIPFGSPIGEAITTVIPHQKLERVVDFVEVLNYKIKNAERKIEEHEIKSQEFTDLLEDALGQASRAISKERIEYIASLLKNSLSNDELEHIARKKLLSLLEDLNDAEIIWLAYYSRNNKELFYENHLKVLGNQPDEDKRAMQDSYTNTLEQLGLIENRAQFKSTKLGNLLLKYLDLK